MSCQRGPHARHRPVDSADLRRLVGQRRTASTQASLERARRILPRRTDHQGLESRHQHGGNPVRHRLTTVILRANCYRRAVRSLEGVDLRPGDSTDRLPVRRFLAPGPHPYRRGVRRTPLQRELAPAVAADQGRVLRSGDQLLRPGLRAAGRPADIRIVPPLARVAARSLVWAGTGRHRLGGPRPVDRRRSVPG